MSDDAKPFFWRGLRFERIARDHAGEAWAADRGWSLERIARTYIARWQWLDARPHPKCIGSGESAHDALEDCFAQFRFTERVVLEDLRLRAAHVRALRAETRRLRAPERPPAAGAGGAGDPKAASP